MANSVEYLLVAMKVLNLDWWAVDYNNPKNPIARWDYSQPEEALFVSTADYDSKIFGGRLDAEYK
jgi:hypothetical protein